MIQFIFYDFSLVLVVFLPRIVFIYLQQVCVVVGPLIFLVEQFKVK